MCIRDRDVRYIVGAGEDFKVDYNDVVPSVSMGIKLGPTQTCLLYTSYKVFGKPLVRFLRLCLLLRENAMPRQRFQHPDLKFHVQQVL